MLVREKTKTPRRSYKKKAILVEEQEATVLGPKPFTKEEAIEARGLFSSIANDWDDPAMDVYNNL